MEWTSNGPRSNLESGLVPGGRSRGELIDRNNFATPGEARRDVFEFIEGWYNPHRLELERKLRHLRLSGLARVFDVRLQQAVQGRLSHQEFFELLIDDELTRRRDRLLERRLRPAQFPEQKHLEDFNFSFNHSINRQQIFDLATCRFIEQRRFSRLSVSCGM